MIMLNFLLSLRWSRGLILFGGLSIILIGGYTLIIKPAQQSITKLQKDNRFLGQNIRKARQEIKHRKWLQNNNLNLRDKLKYQAQFNEERFLTAVTLAANLAKVNVTTVAQGRNIFDLTAIGNYQQLGQFMQLLTQIPYPLAWNNWGLTPKLTSLLFHAIFIITPSVTTTISPSLVFTLSQSFISRDPFMLQEQKIPLAMWPVNALRFVGVLRQDAKIWAILSDPNGGIHHVTLGTPIGLEKSPIIKITAQEIVAQNSKQEMIFLSKNL